MGRRLFKDDLTDTWFKLGIAFGILTIPVIVLFFVLGDYLANGGIKCAVYSAIHIYCPGCGGTRSFYQLIHGHFIKSILMNPFVPYTYADYLIFMINTILVKVVRNILLLAFHITCL